MSGQSAHDIITTGLDAFDGDPVPVSAMLLVSALDAETGAETLYLRRDSDSPVWKHLGMLEIYRDDLLGDARDDRA